MNTDAKIVAVSDIQPESVRWLWRNFIPMSRLSECIGDGGIGKSTMSLALIADITSGRPLPGLGSDISEPSNVLYLNVEDNYADTVRPRLEQLGADTSRVFTIEDNGVPLTLTDTRIEHAIVQTNAVACFIDPLQCYNGSASIHSANAMRPLLKQLASVAEHTGCAINIVSHLTKNGGKAQYRGFGSADIYAAMRSVMLVGKLPLDENMRAVVNIKNNLAPLAKPIAFGFDEKSGFTWLGDVDVTVDEILAVNTTETLRDKAAEFLWDTLNIQPMTATAITKLAKERGISVRTLHRAKAELGVRSVKQGSQWLWTLSPDEGTQNQGCQSDEDCHVVAPDELAAMCAEPA
jgi:hypothetical protein